LFARRAGARKLVADKVLYNKFWTLDIETINDCGNLKPYLICAYNGSEYITSFAKDQKELFSTFMKELLAKIKSGSSITIYAHNLSSFDGIFLLRHLIGLSSVEPLLHNGKLMTIKVKVGEGNKTIIFKDSYLLLPLSLRKLCKAFNVTLQKSQFPFLLNNILYTGILPKFEYWTGISLIEYYTIKAEHKNKFWNFRDEAIKYCKIDCHSLHEIVTKFNELIFKEFSINIHKSPTLPSLSMRIYKTLYIQSFLA
jgi:hypothetical protein